jgi:hypothetical protein
VEPLEDRRLLATFTVTSAADAGPGTLRNAITQANAVAGADVINFSIGAGPKTIALASPLPAVNQSVTINGNTQPGYTSDPFIQISGGGTVAGDGLRLNGGGEVRSLVVNGFDDPLAAGIRVGANVSGFTLRDCFLGTNAFGTAAVPNHIGIAVDPGGSNINLGSATPGQANVISGNLSHGVVVATAAGTVRVTHNRVGTTPDAASALGNGGVGVALYGDGGFVESNVVGGNGSIGIYVEGDGNSVTANKVGTALDGTAPLPNNADPGLPGGGIVLAGADNVIGGAGPLANVVAHHPAAGVVVGFDDAPGAGNTVRGNRFFANAGLPIDLVAPGDPASGITPNDPGDADAGPNNLQNHPLLTWARTGMFDGPGGGVGGRLSGTLNATPNTAYTVDVYADDDGVDAAGSAEAKFVVASTTVTTDAQGDAGFQLDYPPAPPDAYLSATATGRPAARRSSRRPCGRCPTPTRWARRTRTRWTRTARSSSPRPRASWPTTATATPTG